MEEGNASVATLMDENKDLRFEIEQQLNIIESQKQVIYTAERKIECLEKIKLEMEIEIEALTGLHQIKGNLESKVKVLENELSSERLKCTNGEIELKELKEEKNNYELVITELRTKITDLKENEDAHMMDNGHKEDLLNKMNVLQETNQLLTESHTELQNQNKALTDKTVMLEMSLNDKNRELEEMKEMMAVKTNDLKSALKLVEELQEEKALLNAEITSLKCHPVSANKRGNSLFAEVEDKRLTVVNRLEAMQNKYKELKKSFLKKNAELKALEAENIELRKQWKEDENDPYKNMASLVGSYKNRIQELCNTISNLEKRPETPQIISISELTSAHVNGVKALVDNERKLNQQLRNEMEQRSIRELALNEELFGVRQQLRTLKSQAMKDTATIAEFKLIMENMKNTKNKENIAEQIVIPKKEVRMVE